jgi:hypothetical protein
MVCEGISYENFEIKHEGVVFHGVVSLEWSHLLDVKLAIIKRCASLSGGRYVGSYKEGLRLRPTIEDGHVFYLQQVWYLLVTSVKISFDQFGVHMKTWRLLKIQMCHGLCFVVIFVIPSQIWRLVALDFFCIANLLRFFCGKP